MFGRVSCQRKPQDTQEKSIRSPRNRVWKPINLKLYLKFLPLKLFFLIYSMIFPGLIKWSTTFIWTNRSLITQVPKWWITFISFFTALSKPKFPWWTLSVFYKHRHHWNTILHNASSVNYIILIPSWCTKKKSWVSQPK